MEKKKIYIVDTPLVKEWCYKKNSQNQIYPQKITIGSNKKVWWQCNQCGYQWQAAPHNRYKGTNCPQCAKNKISKNTYDTLLKSKGSLLSKFPDIAKEWDYERNGNLTPEQVTPGSGKFVWWKCKHNHSWRARICNRTAGSGCIYCANQKAIKGKNDLKTLNPDFLREWDYEKNKNITPEDCMIHSNKKVWWKCELGHSWQATIAHRKAGTKCPRCFSEHGTSFAEQALYYYLSKHFLVKNRNKVFNEEIDIYIPNLKIGFEYDGKYYHSDKKRKTKDKQKDIILSQNNITLYRIKEDNKNYLDNIKKIIYCKPDRQYLYIQKLLDNIGVILNVDFGTINLDEDSSKIYSQYVLSIKNNNFTKKHKELLLEWDYDHNVGLKPENFTEQSSKKVWWKCNKCGSSYLATISHKVEGTKCPYCNGKKVNHTNCLATKYPLIAECWDYIKNTQYTPQTIYFASRKKVWWICKECGESFESPVCSRIRSKTRLCPKCMHKHIGKLNSKK